METKQKRTWAEIDMEALEHNYLALREQIPFGCKFLGVVKADAYGHGAVPVARKLEELGCDYLAVACLDEAAELRQAGIGLPILILGVTPAEFTGELVRYDLTQAVGDLELARAYAAGAREAGKPLKVHIKVDTGMSRLGFLWDAAVEASLAVAALEGLCVEGIFTHFAAADSDEEFTMEQFTRFLTVTDALAEKGLEIPIRHCAASAAVLNYPCTHMDMVRPGIALYGHYPERGMEELCDLRPVMTLKTRVAAVRRVPDGATVSYGRTAKLAGETTLAVLPVGYADGFPRLLSNEGSALIRGIPCPIVGRVCMDLCMAAVESVPDVRVGDEVILYGPEPVSAEHAADLAGTIQYELLTSVARRVPRVYR